MCSGINFADITQLKPSSIDDSYLHFIRQKTKNTKKKDLRPIKIGLHLKAIAIIQKRKNTEHLKANDGQGIICETKADTMSSAKKQDKLSIPICSIVC
ncbi:hypothetical protein [Parasediminibacterium sp. JCM 36343]|uniref:hypothetical protein n=1 Tax=Parasediminibacterium sp. JCM 36343 TaxID=3374279 RepID=UPI00397AF8E3